MGNVKSICKRIDHKQVKFAKPCFQSYDCGYFHIPCGDFIPKNPTYPDFKEWTNFSDFWKVYKEAWLPYANENITLPFIINGDTSVRYYVPLKNFIDGTMIVDGILQAIEKSYYKKGKIEYGVQLYNLIHEKIDGVRINTQEEI